jgi:hypothetical protein
MESRKLSTFKTTHKVTMESGKMVFSMKVEKWYWYFPRNWKNGIFHFSLRF